MFFQQLKKYRLKILHSKIYGADMKLDITEILIHRGPNRHYTNTVFELTFESDEKTLAQQVDAATLLTLTTADV